MGRITAEKRNRKAPDRIWRRDRSDPGPRDREAEIRLWSYLQIPSVSAWSRTWVSTGKPSPEGINSSPLCRAAGWSSNGMLTTTTRNSIYSPLYRLRRRHKRRNGNGRIPRERSSRSSGEVWRIEKQYPGFVAEIDIEKIMGEIKRAARRNPSDFSSQANSKQTCLQNLVFACVFLKCVSIFCNTRKPYLNWIHCHMFCHWTNS